MVAMSANLKNNYLTFKFQYFFHLIRPLKLKGFYRTKKKNPLIILRVYVDSFHPFKYVYY